MKNRLSIWLAISGASLAVIWTIVRWTAMAAAFGRSVFPPNTVYLSGIVVPLIWGGLAVSSGVCTTLSAKQGSHIVRWAGLSLTGILLIFSVITLVSVGMWYLPGGILLIIGAALVRFPEEAEHASI